jgi:3-methyladenine DNA glycosylase AlkD
MMDIKKICDDVRQTLIAGIDAKSLASSARYFKEGEAAKVHGVKMAEVGKIAKLGFQTIKEYPKETIFEICEILWKQGYLEESVVACIWSESLHKKYEPADFTVFERWLSNYVTNWADCDTLCNHTIGSFLMKYPDYIDKLRTWAKTPNRWMRRGSAVSLIIPARKCLFLNDIFEIADILLLDNDDLVQKGYGWLLKAASQASEASQKAVFDYVMKHKTGMPRTALRYAIEKMPADLKTEAMKKP